MSFDWKEFLSQAKELAENAKILSANNKLKAKEAAQRSAVSRAYYAVFHEAEDFLIRKKLLKTYSQEDEPQARTNSHDRVIKIFLDTGRNAGLQPRRKIGEDLMRLKRSRVLADYSSEFPTLETDIENLLEVAERVIVSLGRIM
jgi:uncharacterized protein (UPF0332 family)